MSVTNTLRTHRAPAAVAIVAAVAVAALLGAGCGGSDSDQSGSPSSSTTTARADQMVLELVDCHQAGFPTAIDVEAAEARLSENQELFLDPEGQARFTIIAKDCQDIVIDGASSGPGHFNTAWVRINGPEETRTIEGQADVIAVPTDYFNPVAFQTDNTDFAEATAAFGVPMTLADPMTMDPAALGPMSGSAQDTQSDPPLSYEWTMDNTNPFPPGTNGVVHVLEGPDDDGLQLIYDIECLVDGGWFRNPTTITFEEGSALDDLVGTGYSGFGPSPNLSCDVTITRQSN